MGSFQGYVHHKTSFQIRFYSLWSYILYIFDLWRCDINENGYIEIHVAFWPHPCSEHCRLQPAWFLSISVTYQGMLPSGCMFIRFKVKILRLGYENFMVKVKLRATAQIEFILY